MDSNNLVDPHLREAVQRLVRALQPERVYLFGSQARGEATPDSDYDILVVISHSDQPRYVRAQTAYRALVGIGVPVEVLVLTHEEFDRELPVLASLPATVEREGVLLYAA